MQTRVDLAWVEIMGMGGAFQRAKKKKHNNELWLEREQLARQVVAIR